MYSKFSLAEKASMESHFSASTLRLVILPHFSLRLCAVWNVLLQTFEKDKLDAYQALQT